MNDDHRLAALGGLHDLDRALADDEEGDALVALSDQDLAGLHRPRLPVAGNALDLGIGEHREQMVLAAVQYRDGSIGGHGGPLSAGNFQLQTSVPTSIPLFPRRHGLVL